MSKYKKRLITLIAVEIVLIITHVALDKPATSTDTTFVESGWHFWLALAFGGFVIFYAYSINCKNCGAFQVFRSMSIFNLSWPQEKCWKCGSKID